MFKFVNDSIKSAVGVAGDGVSGVGGAAVKLCTLAPAALVESFAGENKVSNGLRQAGETAVPAVTLVVDKFAKPVATAYLSLNVRRAERVYRIGEGVVHLATKEDKQAAVKQISDNAKKLALLTGLSLALGALATEL